MSNSSGSASYGFWFIMVIAWSVILPDTPVWSAVQIAAMGLVAGLMARAYIKGNPELEARKKRELRTQRIRELEAELNMEPMELWSDEDPDIVARPEKGERSE